MNSKPMKPKRVVTPHPPRLGRPADRQELILKALRGRIVAGDWKPGERLPTRPEIEAQFGAGTSTVQRALDRLKTDGFIQSHGRNGTIVALRPPHLTRYALAFGPLPHVRSWSRYWTALVNEAQAIQAEGEVEIPIFYGVNGHVDTPGYQQLAREVEDQLLAGVITPERNHGFEASPLWNYPGLVVAAVGHDVPLDAAGFWERACSHLVSRGRRKLALLTRADSEHTGALIEETVAKFGMELHPYWWQSPSDFYMQASRNAVHLLFSGPPSHRPDSLIISDDNMVEAATHGLLAAGVKVGKDVDVVAHSNFPWPPSSVVRVRLLGFNAREILTGAMSYIERVKSGDTSPVHQPVLARFEDELDRARIAR